MSSWSFSGSESLLRMTVAVPVSVATLPIGSSEAGDADEAGEGVGEGEGDAAVAQVGSVGAKAWAVVPAGFAPILSYPHSLPQLAARRAPPWQRLPRKHSPGSPASGNPESRATGKIRTAPPSRSLRRGASGLMKRSCLPSNCLERGRTQNQIPVLPITATPATMESAMAVRLRALPTECEMNVDGVDVMGRALSESETSMMHRY